MLAVFNGPPYTTGGTHLQTLANTRTADPRVERNRRNFAVPHPFLLYSEVALDSLALLRVCKKFLVEVEEIYLEKNLFVLPINFKDHLPFNKFWKGKTAFEP